MNESSRLSRINGSNLVLALYLVSLTVSIAVMEITSSILIAVMLVDLWRRPANLKIIRAVIQPLLPGFLLMLTAAALSFWQTQVPTQVVVDTLCDFRWIFTLAAVFWATTKLRWKPVPFVTVALILLSLISYYAILQRYTGIDVARSSAEYMREHSNFSDSANMRLWRARGFFNNPMTFGHAWSFFLMLPWFAIFYPPLRSLRQWSVVAFVVVASGLLMSLTRGAWLAGLGGFAVIYCVQFKKTLLRSLVVLTGLSTVVFLVFPENPVLERARSMVDLSNSGNQERLKIWRANFEVFLNSPWVGVGYQNTLEEVTDVYRKYAWPEEPMPHAHNEFLNWLSGAGIVGLIGYLVFLSSVFLIFFRLVFGNMADHFKAPEDRLLGALGMAWVAVLVVGGFTECNFSDAEIAHIFCAGIGVLLGILWQRRNHDRIGHGVN